MDADAQLQLEPHLRPGERLLWCGGPDPLVRLTPADGFLIPFSMLSALDQARAGQAA
jgi:hypothetical protein